MLEYQLVYPESDLTRCGFKAGRVSVQKGASFTLNDLRESAASSDVHFPSTILVWMATGTEMSPLGHYVHVVVTSALRPVALTDGTPCVYVTGLIQLNGARGGAVRILACGEGSKSFDTVYVQPL